jgi:hypothetical protein
MSSDLIVGNQNTSPKFMSIVRQVVKFSKIKWDQIKWDLDPISEFLSLELSG